MALGTLYLSSGPSHDMVAFELAPEQRAIGPSADCLWNCRFQPLEAFIRKRAHFGLLLPHRCRTWAPASGTTRAGWVRTLG